MSKDPIGEFGGMNLYCAMLNNQENLVDPIGMRCRVGIVFGHAFDLDLEAAKKLNQKYTREQIIRDWRLLKGVVTTQFAYNETLRLFKRSDQCDAITSITCYSGGLASYLYEYAIDEFGDTDKIMEWVVKVGILDPNLISTLPIGGGSLAKTKRLEEAFKNALQFASDSKERMCDKSGDSCCADIIVTWHIDPDRFDNWKKLVNPENENKHKFYYIGKNVEGRNKYDPNQKMKNISFRYGCDNQVTEYLGELSDAEIDAWVK